jgi:hypothetical protein
VALSLEKKSQRRSRELHALTSSWGAPKRGSPAVVELWSGLCRGQFGPGRVWFSKINQFQVENSQKWPTRFSNERPHMREISSATLDQLIKKRSDLKQDMIGAAAPLMLKAMLIAATGSLPLADSIMEQYFKVPGEKFSISLEELAAISPIVDATNAFIISHEYAHANPAQWERHTFGPEELLPLLRLIGENAASEFDADLTGTQLALHYNAHAGRHGPEYSCLGILLFFDLMRLQRRANETICGVQAGNEEAADSISHPPLLSRRTRVADTIKRLHGLPTYTERGFAITETFSIAIEFIWENTRPFLEHLHKSGLAQHLDPECRVGWLTDDFKRLVDLEDDS